MALPTSQPPSVLAPQPHPYHYWQSKNITQRVIDFAVPLGLFLLLFYFYNHLKISPSEMIKTTGLLSITLLGVTLIIGPLSAIFTFANLARAHRKFWGITSALIGLVHVVLVTIYYYKFNFAPFLNFSSPKYPGLLSGIIALLLLLIITFTSNQKSIRMLSPRVWKAVQTASYLALFLSLTHFYLMESTNGVLIIKRLAGKIVFGFSAAVILARIAIIFLPKK